jgi:quercetin dioxygenase-like cupin family protein
MPFIDPNDIAANATLIGEQDGTAAIYLVRQTVSAGYYAGMHYHHGDEAIRVVSGEVCCRIGDETRVCGPGTILVIPPNVEHGFIVRADSVLETSVSGRSAPTPSSWIRTGRAAWWRPSCRAARGTTIRRPGRGTRRLRS